jgi:ADP-heptose:LPS heptosyltransferase
MVLGKTHTSALNALLPNRKAVVKTPDPASVKSILVLRLRAFGDTLLTTPTLRGLKRAYPDAKLSIVLEPAMAQVVQGLPYLDEVIPFDRLGPKKRGKLAELKATLAFWRLLRSRKFDLVVDVLGTPRTAAMALATGAPVRVGFAFRVRRWAYTRVHQPSKERKYIADYTADVLRALGLEPDSLDLDFVVGSRAQAAMDAWLRDEGLALGLRPLMVQGAGGWELKRYPLELMGQAVRLASQSSGRPAVLLWGPGEEAMTRKLAAFAGPCARLAPPTDFEGMGALLKRGACLLTNDNATKHLAVACGCPTVTVFGPTSDVAWHPSGDVRHLSVKLALDCMPCEALTCWRGDHACLRHLPPAQVAQAVRGLVQGAP